MRCSTKIRPPRPKHVTPPSNIKFCEDNDFLAQPKLNGSCGVLEKISGEVTMFSRHGGTLSLFDKSIDFSKILPWGGDTIICGEYMNKSKKDADNKSFNHKFVIFDILMIDGKDLRGTKFSERYDLIRKSFDTEPFDGFIDKITDNIYVANCFESNFSEIFCKISAVDMYEGLVFKKPYGVLERYDTDTSNKGWQLKVRKECSSYKF